MIHQSQRMCFGLYYAGLKALHKKLEERKDEKVSTTV